MNTIIGVISAVYGFLWGDLVTIPLPGGGSVGVSLLVVLLIPTGIYFTIRTRFLPVRLFPEMLRITVERKTGGDGSAISGVQALIVSTATRVGMGNLIGVVAAISAGGAGAVLWMWLSALIGSSTAFIEAALAQKYKERDPLYGGWRGGPAYYIHSFAERQRGGEKRRYSVIAVLFAISGLICWCGISQVISNSVSSAFKNAFAIPPLWTTVVLVAVSAVIVLRKNATVKVLDVLVPIMAVCYFVITLVLIGMNVRVLPSVFQRIFEEAFGLRQAVAGGFGAVLMNGVKRGLFSNEAGSGSAPCAAAAADSDHPAKTGLLQALGVFIDTIVICSCTAFIMLVTPQEFTAGLEGMDLLQASMQYHLGRFGVVFIALILWLFSFSTFIGILFYARSNVAYLFGDNWASQTGYKILALVMLFIGGLAAYTFVWDLGDVGIGLMTIFNILVILPMSKEALASLRDYEERMRGTSE
ncbi:MAG: alanine:cation symporter family protein [Oscillibacter sp.]|nr:alanine:cation symporter family protein [Oscillibacter sp.]